MLEAAGVRARIYNLYYSGCRLEQHWNWWKEDASAYESLIWYDSKGRYEANNVSLRYALEQ